jgi:hypothetical protein
MSETLPWMSSLEICSDSILPKKQPGCPRHVVLSRRSWLRMYGLVLGLVDISHVRLWFLDPGWRLGRTVSTENDGADEVVCELCASIHNDIPLVVKAWPG